MRIIVQGYENIQNVSFLLMEGAINVITGGWCTCKDSLFNDIKDQAGYTPYERCLLNVPQTISFHPDNSPRSSYIYEGWPQSIQDSFNQLKSMSYRYRPSTYMVDHVSDVVLRYSPERGTRQEVFQDTSQQHELSTLQDIFISIDQSSCGDMIWIDRPERSTPLVASKLLAEMLHYAARRGIQVILNTDCAALIEHISLLTEYRAKGTPILTMFTNLYLDDAGVVQVEQQPNRIDLTTTIEVLQVNRQLYETELELAKRYDGWGDEDANDGDTAP